MLATFYSGRKVSCFTINVIRGLILHREMEMFAGVAASSMPTVHQFFVRRNFSLTSWGSSLKSRLTHLLDSSAREKISYNDPSFTGWGRSDTHTSGDSERFKMRDLESDGCKHTTTKAPRAENSQIHLTQDISITQEPLDDASFKRAETSRYR